MSQRVLTPAQKAHKKAVSQRYYRARKPEYQERSKRLHAKYAESQDRTVSNHGPDKQERIDLGVALLHRVALPGVCYSLQEIAEWAGCRHQAIQQIQARALKKLLKAFQNDPEALEILRDCLAKETEDRPSAGEYRIAPRKTV